ncbi:MAG: transglycosylase [Synechococcaceae bacterium WB8_1B_136]|nr:transglycosylase [Synechococcaceae bacterium WB8_1B_136]
MSAALVALFAPYCDGANRAAVLEQALERLAVGSWRGARPLQPSGLRPFELRWSGEASPLEPSRCTLTFPEQAEVRYSFALPAYQLVLWLMDGLEAGGDDLPIGFWHWLLLGASPETRSA